LIDARADVHDARYYNTKIKNERLPTITAYELWNTLYVSETLFDV